MSCLVEQLVHPWQGQAVWSMSGAETSRGIEGLCEAFTARQQEMLSRLEEIRCNAILLLFGPVVPVQAAQAALDVSIRKLGDRHVISHGHRDSTHVNRWPLTAQTKKNGISLDAHAPPHLLDLSFFCDNKNTWRIRQSHSSSSAPFFRDTKHPSITPIGAAFFSPPLKPGAFDPTATQPNPVERAGTTVRQKLSCSETVR